MQEDDDFDTLVRKVQSRPESFHHARRLLGMMREKEIRRPDLVIAYAPTLLHKKSKLGDEGGVKYIFFALDG